MRKKVLFMMINMNIGGMEKALLNMISAMPKNEYDITVFLLEEYGGFLDHIPPGVKIELFSGYEEIKELLNEPPLHMAKKLFKEGKVIKAGIISFLHLISKISKDRSPYFNYLLMGYPKHNEEYDVAVAYAGPNDFISFFLVKHIEAKQKIQWIHFDVTKIGFNKKFSTKIYENFNKIYVVSKEAKEKLLSCTPNITKKTEVFQNIISPEQVFRQSKSGKGFVDSFDGLRILTVGRLASEKGQDIAIQALAKLKKDGFNVRWYCLGDGDSKVKYETLIEKYDVKEDFILLGSDPNPYPFMEQCDIYVQPSRYEGFCLTLIEARFFKKPIVTTDVNGASEQITHGENGLIVGINAEELYEGIKLLINNEKMREAFTKRLAIEDFGHFTQINDVFS